MNFKKTQLLQSCSLDEKNRQKTNMVSLTGAHEPVQEQGASGDIGRQEPHQHQRLRHLVENVVVLTPNAVTLTRGLHHL